VAVNATTNRITGSPYAYDANGNMTNDGINPLVYDAENHAVSSSSGAYSYDGKGLRVKKCLPNCTSPTTTTVYLFSGSKVLAEYDNGAASTAPSREYIYSGAALLAKIDSSGTKYYHQDHLSNRLVTDSSGTTSAQLGHFPFGESWYNAANDKLRFTSYERDAESGNDFATARYHINRLGRFSSPDPVAGSIDDPQSWNRYAYVSSNPVNLIDPLGMNVKFPWDDWFGGMCFNLGYNDPYQDNRWVSAGMLCFGGGGNGSPSGDPGGGGGIGNGQGKGEKAYSVNLGVLNDCLQSLGIPVKVVAFKPSTPGGTGYAIGIGPDTFARGGQIVPIVVSNDASTYTAAQLGPLSHSPSGWAYGWTPPVHQLGSPYRNFTNNNNNAYGTVITQVHELGHSLWDIFAGSPLVPEPQGEAGKALEDCVKNNKGISGK
jgi:RHS repeat-associated protein